MNTRLIRTPGIYLVGFMGSGKTTIGALLADELGWRFDDLDHSIEASAGVTISEVFERAGETEFRRLEHEALVAKVRSIQRGQPTVLSLGGGAFAQPENLSLVQDNGISVWLDCSLERIRARIAGQEHRPLARDPQRFEALYHARQPVYAQADYRVEVTCDDPKVALNAILDLPFL
jgi:shikimate kinase